MSTENASTENGLAELHLHIEGSLEPELIFSLAERNRITLPYNDLDELRALYDFTDLQSFLDLYYANTAVLQTAEDFADLARAYFARARQAGVTHAEIFFDPQAHTERGVPLEAVVEGLADAAASSEREFGVSSGLIASILRDKPVLHANQLLDDLLAMKAPIIGLGLDSAEVGYPPSLFVDVFAKARAEGLHVVAHAGEEGPASYIWEALDLLKVERIDHGVRCLDDEALVNHLVEKQIPLTVCPLSNVRLQVVQHVSEVPVKQMLGRGLLVTINSDDPAYFGGYVDDNLDALDLTADERATLAANSVAASFS